MEKKLTCAERIEEELRGRVRVFEAALRGWSYRGVGRRTTSYSLRTGQSSIGFWTGLTERRWS
jgi:hypothetical protein